MTDPHDIDELASALLDGTTSPEEAALLSDDPALLAQVERRAADLRAVRSAIGDVPAVEDRHRDAAIAAALAAYDDDHAQASAPADTTVVPLAPRRGLSPRVVRALGAAAVVLLVALLVPLLARRDDDTAELEASGRALETTVTTGSGTSGDAETASPEAKAGAGSATADAAGFLGSFDDLDALATAVASPTRTDTQRAFDAADAAGAALCVPLDTSTSAAWLATVDGVAVEVHLDADSEGTRTLTVFDRESCALLDERAL
ncbi:MAG: hypothetical protein ACJ739_02855 [Acidimicrobiales bacterium]